MKQIVWVLLFSVFSALVLPLVTFLIMNAGSTAENDSENSEEMISVYFHGEDKVKQLPLEKYLVGVVAAEMPATFETEALKAQAVAARSYAVYKKQNPPTEHPQAHVCTDYKHCKAYKETMQMEKDWGDNKGAFLRKITSAVNDTQGEVVTYNGEAALTVFHSQAGSGKTENSKDVWGGDVPYLVSVSSYGEETAPDFYSSKTVAFSEFKEKLCAFNPEIDINSSSDIGEIVRSEGGGVKEVIIGGVSVSGKDMRSIFGLRSSCFEINVSGDSVRFEVSGYGHGVGMSQYGANTMAKEGYTYKQILTHYYSGTQIEIV